MGEFPRATAKIEALFCCPICKGTLAAESEISLKCVECAVVYYRHGDIYDFRVGNADTTERWRSALRPMFASKERWFSIVSSHYNESDYENILFDSRMREIESHVADLTSRGIRLGERYDRELLVPGSIRDLHELLIAINHIPSDCGRKLALDLGCGTLRGTKRLLDGGFEHVIAVDLLPEMMDYGHHSLREDEKDRVTLVQADVRFLPFAQGTADLVFSLQLFEHVDPALLHLLDICRVLSRDGVAVFNTWNGSGLSYRSQIKTQGKSSYRNGFFYHFYEQDEVKKLLDILNVDYSVRPFGFYGGRRLANKVGYSVLKPAILIDGILSRILPSFLFPFLLVSIRNRPRA